MRARWANACWEQNPSGLIFRPPVHIFFSRSPPLIYFSSIEPTRSQRFNIDEIQIRLSHFENALKFTQKAHSPSFAHKVCTRTNSQITNDCDTVHNFGFAFFHSKAKQTWLKLVEWLYVSSSWTFLANQNCHCKWSAISMVAAVSSAIREYAFRVSNYKMKSKPYSGYGKLLLCHRFSVRQLICTAFGV